MLILFGRDRTQYVIRSSMQRPRGCMFAEHVAAYTSRKIEPDARAAFEQHLIECEPCQRAVNLGRVSNELNHHNRSVGTPCAAQTRRKS